MILANCLPHYVFLFPGLVNCNGLCGFHNTKMNRFRGIGLPTAFSKASGMYYILISQACSFLSYSSQCETSEMRVSIERPRNKPIIMRIHSLMHIRLFLPGPGG